MPKYNKFKQTKNYHQALNRMVFFNQLTKKSMSRCIIRIINIWLRMKTTTRTILSSSLKMGMIMLRNFSVLIEIHKNSHIICKVKIRSMLEKNLQKVPYRM